MLSSARLCAAECLLFGLVSPVDLARLIVAQVYAEFLGNHVFPKLTRPSYILNDNLAAHFTEVRDLCVSFDSLSCCAAGDGQVCCVPAQTTAETAEQPRTRAC